VPNNPKIVVVGSANTDFVLRVPELPAQGETVLGDSFQVVRGGKGANQAVAAARLGGNVTFVARLGSDSFGDQAIAAYREEGIQTDFIIQDPEVHSGVALIMVNRSGENIIAVGPGANGQLTPQDVQAASTAIQQADCLLLQLEIPLDTVQAAIEIAHRHQVRVILNPAPARTLPAEMLELVDILTPNQSEAAILAGEQPDSGGEGSIQRLASVLGVRNMVVTLGSRGAMILEDGKSTLVPAFPITPVDTTAAGDAFNGALAVSLARGESLAQAARYANAAGAMAASRPGAQPSLPSSKELEDFMASSAPGPSPEVPAAVNPTNRGATLS
jgi:ribokinase